jgi:Flp pilus assembly protein TadD
VRLNPELTIAQYNLAMSYLADGKREEAQKCLEILKKLDAELAHKLQKEFYKNYVVDVGEENN